MHMYAGGGRGLINVRVCMLVHIDTRMAIWNTLLLWLLIITPCASIIFVCSQWHSRIFALRESSAVIG